VFEKLLPELKKSHSNRNPCTIGTRILFYIFFYLMRYMLIYLCFYIIINMLFTVGSWSDEMSIVQSFYDNLASQYDKLFFDWQTAVQEQATMLQMLFSRYGFDHSARVLDCACGIGTQAIGLAVIGYDVTASDISDGALAQAMKRASQAGVNIRFEHRDFRNLSDVFSQPFDIVIAMDNALPHMLTPEDLQTAVVSITEQINDHGIFVGSIRDYDALLQDKPPYSPPYIYQTNQGQRVSFQTWEWTQNNYKLTQYIINDEDSLQVSKFECEYRAVCRQELTDLFLACGCHRVDWLLQKDTGFYQPIVIARK